MPNELFDINTTETLGVTPRYVLQHNAISRSAHNFSATARKLTAMAMALLPPDLSNLSAAFTFTEFCNALGYTKSGKSFTLFKAALRECMKSVIEVEGPPDKNGQSDLFMFHWFKQAKYVKKTGVCTMTFDQDLAEFLKELKRLYAKINLIDIGKLQSRYALRIYEIALSYKSLQGKDGNKDQAWYIERTIPELRKLFGIAPNKYQENYLLRQKVIEGPVQEINESGIGIEIKTESIKKGRSLAGIRFNCMSVTKTTKKKRRKKVAPLSDIPPADPESKTAKEEEHLKELYPDEFAGLYQEELGKLKPIGGAGESFRRTAAEHSALKILRERHGIVK